MPNIIIPYKINFLLFKASLSLKHNDKCFCS